MEQGLEIGKRKKGLPDCIVVSEKDGNDLKEAVARLLQKGYVIYRPEFIDNFGYFVQTMGREQ